MAKKITITEVGPRDGLQNENINLSLRLRHRLIENLAAAGVRHIEAGAFVSPVWVPQMAQSAPLLRSLLREQEEGAFPGVRFSALVPNVRGMEDAVSVGMKDVAVFGSCSESFSRKNINCSIAESFSRFAAVMQMAQKHRIRVRGYLSTAFGCPYEGPVPIQRVVTLTLRLLKMGVREVSIGDTIGVATPKQVSELLDAFKRKKIDFGQIAMHFHDTRGMALANTVVSLQKGITSFDSSVGGLGGCPYAEGAAGNVATEDLLYLLEGMGYQTGIDLVALTRIRPWLEKYLAHTLPARVRTKSLSQNPNRRR